MSTGGGFGRLDPAVAAVRRAVREGLADIEPGSAVLVACSGGPDSMSLAAATCFEGVKAGWLVRALVVDHGLQADSPSATARVVSRLHDLGIEAAEQTRVSVDSAGGPEAAAREARYAALSAAAAPDDATVLLGHTLDDQAETVLLGLSRGSGLLSLSGMAATSGRYRRPLLQLRRQTTISACEAQRIEVYDDPHNADPRFTRVRVRREVMPVLEDVLGPGVVEALGRTATAARRDNEVLDTLAAGLFQDARDGDHLRVDVLQASPASLRRRVLRLAALAGGCPAGDLFSVHVDAIDRLITNWHGQAAIDLPGRVGVERTEGSLVFLRA